ncbi:MAG: excinuclease ABC subunit UvrB, partial [Candidatus Nanoarchaeia archaeon]|nr:excinuclease ABC subunit UvrB [Candidatus Nanoarchaeia archaeon]
TLLGVTGSGKTFTIANVINAVNKPVLVLSHNKTLAAQLYNEFKEFFPNNRVEYFISYYDYYQPESYLPAQDKYIEKDALINPRIEQYRLSATASLMSGQDTIVVASVSCIYGLGNPKNFLSLGFELRAGKKIKRDEVIKKLVNMLYERNQIELVSGRFRVTGNIIDVVLSYMDDVIRIEFEGDMVESIKQLDKNTLDLVAERKYFYFFPAKHFVSTEEENKNAIKTILKELDETLPLMNDLEAHRLRQRVLYDVEMIKETGTCKGIENYSRHFDARKKGEKPYCLLDYFPKDFLLIIDESHQSLPQLNGMYKGDYARKKNLIDYGFRLPSAYDNRPLKFNEFEDYMNNVIFVSATPADYELNKSGGVVEQIIRPTGLIDPEVIVKPINNQVNDLLEQINFTIKKGYRCLVTTLTKKLAEELTEFLAKKKIKARYLHSEIGTLDRTEIIRQLRAKEFDVLVGINLLREGLDLPEVGFIGILDADKEGFLRDAKSLIQIIGRAARNSESYVILYADKMTDSIKKAVSETSRRREMQIAYNKKNNITPKTIIKPVKAKEREIADVKHIPKSDIPAIIENLQLEMDALVEELNFEKAIILRDKINELKKRL